MSEEYLGLAMEFQPCSGCARDRASCDQCFWVKETRRQATIEREAEAALDAADRTRGIPEPKLIFSQVVIDIAEHERLKRIEAAARTAEKADARLIAVSRRGVPGEEVETAIEVICEAQLALRQVLEAK